MSAAYNSTSHPQTLSATAALIRRLRHPLRTKRSRHPTPPSHSSSVASKLTKRLPRAEDERPVTSPAQSLPRELPRIKDKGDFAEHRYGNVNLYWNSVMMEASEQEKARRVAEIESNGKQRNNDRVFADSEQLCRAYDCHHRDQRSIMAETTVTQQTHCSLDTHPAISALDPHSGNRTEVPLANGNCGTDPTANSSVKDLHALDSANADLTWNSALTRILASPYINASLSSSIKARAHSYPPSSDKEEFNMRAVSFVPNFSYPIAAAQWYDTRPASTLLRDFENGVAERSETTGGRELDGAQLSTLGVNGGVGVFDFGLGNGGDGDSLYRVPTPTSTLTHAGSGLENGFRGNGYVSVDGES
ncbi:hypothetical protein OPT61_g8764 [Boeremia exigua]|uniref:Uncharacterized protein n=1 Tax=Boeremia exigua TaxID=749465 RepID=A0ACC2HXP6_9PLEO|nr:hypothetical protein OPT61_g8764 [Boeremia exigua]